MGFVFFQEIEMIEKFVPDILDDNRWCVPHDFQLLGGCCWELEKIASWPPKDKEEFFDYMHGLLSVVSHLNCGQSAGWWFPTYFIEMLMREGEREIYNMYIYIMI